jgi:hypothetical protein
MYANKVREFSQESSRDISHSLSNTGRVVLTILYNSFGTVCWVVMNYIFPGQLNLVMFVIHSST